jgi:hypothetical protein
VGPLEFVCARIRAVAWCVLVLTVHDLGAGVLLRRPTPADHARAGEHEGIKQWPGHSDDDVLSIPACVIHCWDLGSG